MTEILASWRDGATRRAITEFVEALDIPDEERIAVFDNDGTLWCEKPMPIQLDFLVRRFADLANDRPDLRDRQPYKAAYEHDLGWLADATVKHYHGDDSDLQLLERAVEEAFNGVPIDDYADQVMRFFADATHPVTKRPYLHCGYQPMIELLCYLEAHGFATYIASAGDRDFMRPVASTVYGIPPERVIGSSVEISYAEDAATGYSMLYKNKIEFFDDGPTKPVRIWSRVGRRPIVAVGNSNGDLPMLRFARDPALRILLNHDDAERENAYTTGAEQALAEAATRGWVTISMQSDWTEVFIDQ